MRKVLLVLAVLACVGQASAQSKWGWKFGLGGTLNSGNVNNVNFNTNGGVERNDSVLAFDAHYAFVYGKQDSVVNNLGISGGIKFDVWQYNTWSPFVADEMVHNTYKGTDFKNSFLFGLKWKFFYGKGYDYSFSAALVGDYTDYHFGDAAVSDNGFMGDGETADSLSGWKARVSLRYKMKQKISDYVSFNLTAFYQPNVADFSDVLATVGAKMESKLTKNLTFNVAFDLDYKSVVPEGVKNTDIVTSCGFTLKF